MNRIIAVNLLKEIQSKVPLSGFLLAKSSSTDVQHTHIALECQLKTEIHRIIVCASMLLPAKYCWNTYFCFVMFALMIMSTGTNIIHIFIKITHVIRLTYGKRGEWMFLMKTLCHSLFNSDRHMLLFWLFVHKSTQTHTHYVLHTSARYEFIEFSVSDKSCCCRKSVWN